MKEISPAAALGAGLLAIVAASCGRAPLPYQTGGAGLNGGAGSTGSGTGTSGNTAGSGAGNSGFGGAAGNAPSRRVVVLPDGVNRKLDLLFMVDNSSETWLYQQNLVKNLPAFMNTLKGLQYGLPDLHIAVVTSDMGAGDGSITGCFKNGDNGVFKHAPEGSCKDTTLAPGATFIADTGGSNPVTNFGASDITDVLSCIVQVGESGCGFEHQLAAVARALGADGQPAPPENQGFLRPEANLGIIMITNEDDCSAPVDSLLYDTTTNQKLASVVGPPGNFRCNEFGHLCGSPLAPPPRLSPKPTDLTFTETLDGCVSAEGQGMLTPVADFVAGIRGLKAFPDQQILVSSIQGPVAPYTIKWRAAPIADTGPWPEIVHSCDAGAAGGWADPGIRMQQFAQAFGGNNVIYPVCSDNFGPGLQEIATKMSALASPTCFEGAIRNDVSSGTPVPECVVTDHVPSPSGDTTDTVIASCASNGHKTPCWRLTGVGDLSCPTASYGVTIDRGTTPPPDGASMTVDCAICPAGSTDPGCR